MLTREDIKRSEKENIAANLQLAGGRIFGTGGAAELLKMKPTTLASCIKAPGVKRKWVD
jgi:transcriptional regulator with GAF, ATPase, and Fis domain